MKLMTLDRGDAGFVCNDAGIYVPVVPVQHRDEEYDSDAFDILRDMQGRHFWYRGRHRFLLHAVRQVLGADELKPCWAIDLGGGCGGWNAYLQDREPGMF